MSQQVKRSLGLWRLTALVAGNMIGSGVFMLPAALANFGTIGVLAWIATAFGALCLALVFAHLGGHFPKVGGPYAYARMGFGEFVGFQMAYNYWIALWVGNAAIVVAAVAYLTVFFPILSTDHVMAFIASMIILWTFTLVNVIGVREASVVQVITTILKLLPLILIAVVGVFYVQKSNLMQFNITGHSNFTAITGAATLTLWSFIGLESATVPVEDVIEPKKNIPRATIFGVIIAASVYILSSFAIMGMIPLKVLQNSNSPYADAANILFGAWTYKAVAIAALVACFGTLNGWILMQAQIPLAAAKDKLFPQIFAKRSKSGSPVFGLIFTSVLISGLLALSFNQSLVHQFTLVILIAVLASLIPYLFTTMTDLLCFIEGKYKSDHRHLGIRVFIAILAAIYIFWAIVGAGKSIVYYGALLLLSSLPAYVIFRFTTRKS